MITTTLILFYSLTLLLILISIFVKSLTEVSLFGNGFLLITVSIMATITGVEVRTGEQVTNSTTVEYVYTPIEDVSKLSFVGINFAIGLGLFFGAWNLRKDRKESEY